jgi:hypothetical protein
MMNVLYLLTLLAAWALVAAGLGVAGLVPRSGS